MISLLQPKQEQHATGQLHQRFFKVLSSGNDYAVAAGITVFVLVLVMQLWRFDINIPIIYGGDDLAVGVWSKTIYEHGWYMQNPRLGAPLEFSMGDYPVADGLHQFVYKILSWFTPNYVVGLNLFYLLTFPLTTATSLFVLKRLGISRTSAIVCSVLYSFLPYKFYRSMGHLYLVAYYMVPLSILTIIWLYFDRISIRAPKDASAPDDTEGRRGRLFGSVAICFVHGFAGVYYAFFSCYLLLVAGVSSALNRRKLAPLLTGILLIAVTCSAVLINLLPHMVHSWQHGKNTQVGQRTPYDSEVFALKISQLVLPVPNNRFEPLAKLVNYYNVATSAISNENQFSSLGAVGALGFVVLIFQLLRRKDRAGELIDGLSRLNLFAILLGTVGGFSALFSILVSPSIRAYNRISIFIAFFAFCTVGLLLDQFRRHLSRVGAPRGVFYGFLALTLGLGLLDEVPSRVIPGTSSLNPQFTIAPRWKSDAEFFRQVEDSMPEGAAVFQYPHISFPESPAVHTVVAYDHARGYLHTDNLRWSFPMRGRRVDLVAAQIVSKPMEEQLQALAYGGFSGIYVDRGGYPDHGAAIEGELSELLQSTPIVSPDGRMAFYSTIEYASNVRQSLSPAEWESQVNLTWFSPIAVLGPGFHALEQDGAGSWRWCSARGELILVNSESSSLEMQLEFICAPALPQEETLLLEGSILSDRIPLSAQGPTPYSKVFTLPPGRHRIKLTTNAKPLNAPNDPRSLVFQIRSFQFKKVSAANGNRVASNNDK